MVRGALRVSVRALARHGKYLVIDAEYIWKYTHNGYRGNASRTTTDANSANILGFALLRGPDEARLQGPCTSQLPADIARSSP
jgi:hypothetical protein